MNQPLQLPEANIPPQNLEAERAVLAAILEKNCLLANAEAIITADAFYKPAHAKIFKAIQRLRDDAQTVDLITLTKWMHTEDTLEAVGGAFYLTGLPDSIPFGNIETYANLVSEAAQYRQLIAVGRHLEAGAREAQKSPSELLATIPAAVFSTGANYRHIREVIPEVNENIGAVFSNPGAIRGMRTGLKRLDNYTGGIKKTDLVIIGARTSMGKTSLAAQIAWHGAKYENIPALFVSYESTAAEIIERLNLKVSKVDSNKYQAGTLTKEEGARMYEANKGLAGLPIYINDSSHQTIQSVLSSARHMQSRHGLGLVVVDYIQRLETAHKGESRNTQLEEFCRRCKSMAKELECRVIIVSQLSRNPESRSATGFRPILSDLRESGGIEQEADQVWLLYRRSYYGLKTYKDGTPTEGTAEIIVAKNRNGSRGASIRVAFVEKHMLFANLEADEDVPF